MQKIYKEDTKDLPVIAEVDVLVAGGGPAGFAAALGAAQGGAKTLLIEQQSCVGGVATSGLMSHWTGTVNSALYWDVIDESYDKSMHNGGVQASKTVIDPEVLKLVMLERLEEAGVAIRLYTSACSAIMDGDSIIGVVTESKSGRQAIYSKVVIDATGDGDIAAKAGAEFFKGRESDGKMQPVTIMFKVAGVDPDRAVFLNSFESKFETPKGELQQLAKEILPFPAGHVLLYKSTLPGVVTCNMTNCINIDGTSAGDLTKGEAVCRSQMMHILNFLREYVPGYENCYIVSSASSIGVRETRHFIGDYILNEEDIINARVFDDWVVAGAHFNFDVHNISGASLDKTGVQHEFKQDKGYTIPYRCLLPQKTENLLLAGRNISGTHMAHSNFRAMPICFGMGHAAGIAAAIAVKSNIKAREVDATEIQKILISQGVNV